MKKMASNIQFIVAIVDIITDLSVRLKYFDFFMKKPRKQVY
jgi:hypothetical protein